MTPHKSRRVAAALTIFCLLAALFQLFISTLAGGVTSEAVLFIVLALVFGAYWWSVGREA